MASFVCRPKHTASTKSRYLVVCVVTERTSINTRTYREALENECRVLREAIDRLKQTKESERDHVLDMLDPLAPLGMVTSNAMRTSSETLGRPERSPTLREERPEPGNTERGNYKMSEDSHSRVSSSATLPVSR
jgi:hypothetical protein